MVGAEVAIFTVADLSRLWVMATVNIKDIGRAQVGQQAFIRTRQFGNAVQTGTVDWVGDTVDERTRTQRIRIEVDNRSEEHTSELQSLMRISYAVFCLNKNTMNASP